MSAHSGNQQTKTTETSGQVTQGTQGAESPTINASSNSATVYKGPDSSTNLGKGSVVQAAGAANIALADKSVYSPTTNTTTNVTGIDPTAALNAIGQLQLNAAASGGGSGGSTVVIPGAAAPDLSGLGNSISQAITGALGGSTSASGAKSTSNLIYYAGAILLVAAFFFFRKRK